LPFREHKKSLELEFREEEEEPFIVVVVEIYPSATVDFVSCYKKLLQQEAGMSQLLFRFLGLSLSLTLSLPSTTKYETL
jgi:hypothetical protein